MVGNWYSFTSDALQNLWQGFLNFIPAIIGAIVVFLIGWFVAILLGQLVTRILDLIKLNKLFARGQWDEALEKAGIKANVTGFIGAIVKWVLVLVFLSSAAKILNLPEFTEFLNKVVGYLPNVIIAALIFVATVIVSDIVERTVRAAVERVRVGYGQLVSAIIKWAIWIFAILAILIQLKVAASLMQTIFTGFIAVIVISCGLAFGLGGKEVAGDILKDFYKKLKG